MRIYKYTRDINVLIIRHGESQANIDNSKYRSITNRMIELSELGMQQAYSAGHFLSNSLDFAINNSNTIMFSSSYIRALQTANIINSFLSVKLYQEDRLVEQNFGVFDGLSEETRGMLYPNEAEYYYKCKKMKNQYFVRIPMGESPMDVSLRFHSFWSNLENLMSEMNLPALPALNIIIVAHKITNHIIRKELMCYDVEWYEQEQKSPNCSITKLSCKKGEDRFTDFGHIFVT